MKQLRNLLPVLLVCLLTICLPKANAVSETAGTCGENLTWSLDAETGVLTISGSGAMEDYQEGTAPWYDRRENITAVVFGETVTGIGSYALADTALTTVTVPETIAAVGDYAFKNCTALTQIRFEADIDRFDGWCAFYGAGSETGCTMVFAGRAKEIPNGFAYGANITAVDTGCAQGVGADTFKSCKRLKTIVLGETLTSIGEDGFYGCTAVTDIDIYAQTMSTANAFEYVGQESDGVEVVFHDTVETIAYGMFDAFSDSYSPKITAVTIGRNVTFIHKYAFAHLPSLTEVTWLAKRVESNNDNVFSSVNSDSFSIHFGAEVETIPDHLAKSCAGLKSVTIPAGVQYIGNEAFQNCSNLTEVRIEGYLTVLGKNTSGSSFGPFRNCPSATIYGWSGSDAEIQSGYMGNTFVSIGSKQWNDGISSADMPDFDEAANTLTISTPRQLAWLSWMTNQGNTLSGYTVRLATNLDMSGKLWNTMGSFGGIFEGCGYTVSGLELASDGFFGELSHPVTNLYLKDVKLIGGYVLSRAFLSSNHAPFNCGIRVQLQSYRSFTVYNGNMSNSYYVVTDPDGKTSGCYCNSAGAFTSTDDPSVYQTDEFLATLNTLLEGAMQWEFGTDGYPVLLPNSSRSWKDHAVEVTPQDDIYYISTPGELAYIGNLVNNGDSLAGKTVKLMADLDLSGKVWTPIGTDYQTGFDGVFDGDNHTISNLMVGTAEKPVNGYAGLFGCCNSYGELKNVTLKDVAVYGSNAGALVGVGRDITNCHVNGGIVSGGSAGGLAQSAVLMRDCSAVSDVVGDVSVGGLVGSMENYGGFFRCYAICTVSATGKYAGGLAGSISNYGAEITDCYAIGSVKGKVFVGGLFGYCRGNVLRCYAACDVSSMDDLPGMLIGSLGSAYTATDCYWSTDCTMIQSGIPRTPQGVGDRTGDGSVGVPLAKLKQQSTFQNWDFTNVWAMDSGKNSGLPYLRAFDAVSIPLTGLVISETACSVAVGSDRWLTVTPQPAAAAAQVTWTSSDPAVASVSGGKVTGLKEGSAIISAACAGHTVRCTVTVTARPVHEYTIERLTLRGADGAAMTEIPAGSFYAEATITKTAEADSAVVMLVSYTAAGKMLDTAYLRADVPVGTTYSLGTWVENPDGSVGQVKVFLLSSLSSPLPLAASKSIS